MPAPTVSLAWQKTTRFIDTCYPPIDVFADLSDNHEDNIALWKLESRTNPRYQQDHLSSGFVREEDIVRGGHGASIVMAAVMYIGGQKFSRFTDGTFGAYYAGHTLETALREYAFQAERYRLNHGLAPEVIKARGWIAKPIKPLHDVRGKKFEYLLDPDPASYPISAAFARQLREKDSWGLVYRSVRHDGGESIAIFRPPAISLPKQGGLYEFTFDGKKITEVCERLGPILRF